MVYILSQSMNQWKINMYTDNIIKLSTHSIQVSKTFRSNDDNVFGTQLMLSLHFKSVKSIAPQWLRKNILNKI